MAYQTFQIVINSLQQNVNRFLKIEIMRIDDTGNCDHFLKIRRNISSITKTLDNVHNLFLEKFNWFALMNLSNIFSCIFNTYLFLYCLNFSLEIVLFKILKSLHFYVPVLGIIWINIYWFAILSESWNIERSKTNDLLLSVYLKQKLLSGEGTHNILSETEKIMDIHLMRILIKYDAINFTKKSLLQYFVIVILNALSCLLYQVTEKVDMCVIA
ncbi:uncharacterized protein LOC119679855 [Teleopsis dalmanni]|uniref:uncharacterized protein LOC119679855 n=1 Tax=Teleopsis dalmanni TaxID=139649 RepID=UPI0018CE5B68|nr:uncharacterized protein LOC119679855 [Teleopsis dalmanni]